MTVALLLSTVPSQLSHPAAAAQSACYADWSEAGPVARNEGLLPVSDVLRQVADHTEGKVVSIKLCRRDNRYAYEVTIAAPDGRVSRVRVDADNGGVTPLAR
ncbi:MAG: PepSY domain-containing protein [Pseudomonadota bacterium]